MLFSEPKISQLSDAQRPRWTRAWFQCSSASRKFLNAERLARHPLDDRFQCSSASRKFLNLPQLGEIAIRFRRFQCSSASRKFLNLRSADTGASRAGFQCSSASRKFLNATGVMVRGCRRRVSVLFSEPKISQFASLDEARMSFGCFSALQRAENFSIVRMRRARRRARGVSVLFSEPKISQSRSPVARACRRRVSVLFSEPKISQ